MANLAEEQNDFGICECCGSPFWNETLSWNTSTPDLTLCFQRTALLWGPSLFLWMLSPLEAFYLIHSKSRNVPWNPYNITKLAIVALLCIVNVCDLFQEVILARGFPFYSVCYLTPVIQFCTLCLSGALIFFNRKMGMSSSSILFYFWMILALCGVVQFRSEILKATSDSSYTQNYSFISYVIYYCLVVVQFFLNCFADKGPEYVDDPVTRQNPSPEERCSALSTLTFSWFDQLIWLGYKKPLETEDLWPMKAEDSAREVVPRFDKFWEKSVRKVYKHGTRRKASYVKKSGSLEFISGGQEKKKMASIVPALCLAFGPTFMFGIVLKVVNDVLTFANPHLLKLLIDYLESSTEYSWKGFLYAGLMLVSSVCQTLVLSQYFRRMFIVGLRIRTALISAIYRKALKMSSAARKESTVGEIVNLMSVDAQRFMDLVTYINMLWSAPLQIGLALYFLWNLLGPSVLAGVAVMIILIPVNGWLANKMKDLQIKQMKYKDERVKLTNEVLGGIKVIKLYAWEPSFEEQILKIRAKEVKQLKYASYYNAGSSFIWSCAPFLVSLSTFAVFVLTSPENILTVDVAFVSLAYFTLMKFPMSMLPQVITIALQVSLVTFATYVLSDEENWLDSKKAFVSLSLFNILRFPLSMLPMMISNLIQTGVSVNRINRYMNSDELDPNNVTHDDLTSDPILIENGTFSWSSDEKPTLKNINLHVKKGQLVAVVGSVGSGKSSLVSALLGDMEKFSGKVNVTGSVAYVPQQAWVQNASLRNNILFGKALDGKVYNNVLDACALRQDLDMLPGGDQTEIGEKGINLSGGQKQRVSLARAVYYDADVYLLDDPLSAVDSHVGKHIFERVVGPSGILKNKTRILVTHGITYLPDVDFIVVLTDGEISEIGTYKELLDKKGAFAEFLIQHLQESDEVSESEFEEIKTQLEETVGVETLKEIQRQRSESKSESGSLGRRTSTSSTAERTGKRNSSLNTDVNGVVVKEAAIGEKLIEAEKAEVGSVKWSVYSYYLKSVGVGLSVATIIMNILFQAFSIGANYWLNEWSKANSNPNSSHSAEERDMYLGVYGSFGIGQVLTTLCSTVLLYIGCLTAAKILQGSTLHNVLRSPNSFFDVTPLGRVLNRFSKDVDTLDSVLPMTIRGWLTCFFSVQCLSQRSLAKLTHAQCRFYCAFLSTLRPLFPYVGIAVVSLQKDVSAASSTTAVFGLLLDLFPWLGGIVGSYVMHNLMTHNVLRTPMQFFDSTPIGRIVSRFSQDVKITDSDLPMNLSEVVYCSFEVFGTIVVISNNTPIFIAVIVPIGILYYFIQRFYVATSRQLKRVESVTRSPIYSHFGETITGAATIRAYGVQQRFIDESEKRVDFNQVCYYPSLIANRWLAVRLETIGSLIIFFAAVFGVTGKNSGDVKASLVGLSVTYAMQVTQTLNWLVRMTSDVETNIVAVERIKEYGEIPQEAEWVIPDSKPDKEWPSRGDVEFKNYQTRYREGLDLVLCGIDFKVNGGEKIGIVGRTGAGKSSLTLALFRIIEAAGGKIFIDGVDISKLGLHDLRARLTIIPQDPILFSGTIRMNLDPFVKFSDQEVWKALELAHLKSFVQSTTLKLDHEITEGGDNLSVGQRQLMCLARALLRKTKILILDEATAAVDLETDDLIQNTIRTEFRDCTVLTIAHRLNTILDSDRVLVLDKGLIAEFDSPQKLMSQPNSIFYGMLKDAGITTDKKKE